MTRLLAATLLVATFFVYTAAAEEVLFDFEGPYLVDPGRTIKDHEMLFFDGEWHCIYIRGEADVPGTSSETELGYATSADLTHWNIRFPVLEAGPEDWDARNVWAPAIFRTPWNPEEWTMLYTGADASVVQRMGRANTVNGQLNSFLKLAANPVLVPDSTAYDWSPSQDFSSFRDPFHFEKDGVHHVLNTVGVLDSNSSRRGAVHHATSVDLANWTDQGILLQNTSESKAWHDLESVQLIEYDGRWHFFYTEQNEVGVRYLTSDSMDSGWDTKQAMILDPAGIAPEVTPIDSTSFLFTRHTPGQHTAEHPDSLGIYYTLRADTLRFHPTTGQPYVVRTDPLAADWPVRTGTAFVAAPTFVDNALERGVGPSLAQGHGYLSSRDFHSGPGGEFGSPGGDLGGEATGTMKSRLFPIESDDVSISLLVGGGTNVDCFVALVDAGADSVLRDARGHGSATMRPVVWDVTNLAGRQVYIWVEDGSTADNGWIWLDDIRLRRSAVGVAPAVPSAARLLPNVPNPFNPRTQIRFEVFRPGRAELRIFDLRGREVRAEDLGRVDAGAHSWVWEGDDARGRAVASGVYLVRLQLDGSPPSHRRVALLR